MDCARSMSSLVLISKLIGLKPPSKAVIINTIHAIWRFAVDLKIEAMEDSTYLFHFARAQDKLRVLHLVPWNFKGHL